MYADCPSRCAHSRQRVGDDELGVAPVAGGIGARSIRNASTMPATIKNGRNNGSPTTAPGPITHRWNDSPGIEIHRLLNDRSAWRSRTTAIPITRICLLYTSPSPRDGL